MRERAQKIGAELSLSSRDGHGTGITLNIPGHIAYASTRTGRFRHLFWTVPLDDG
jgi:hypothetical protein